MFRVIYIIEAYSDAGELLARRYAANMRTAKKIAKPYGAAAVIRRTAKNEWYNINRREIERLQKRSGNV